MKDEMTNLIIKGLWRLPESENCVAGILNYNEDSGIVLELFGEFHGDNYDIIIGIAKDDTPITLVDCFIKSRPITGFNVTTIIANKILVGKHFLCKDNMKFEAIAYNCSNLEEWLWNSNIQFKEDKEQEKYILEYSKPISRLINLDDLHNLRIYTSAKLPPLMSIPYYQATIEEKSYIKLECTENNTETLDELLLYKNRMDAFLTLSIGAPQKTNDIYGFCEGTKISIYIQTYYVVIAKTILPPNMFINYHWYESRFDVTIKRWFERYCLLEDVFNLYFSLLLQKKTYIHQKFLFRIQVLEAYHRKTHTNDELIQSNKKRIKEILNQIQGDEDKEFLKDKLSFAYEPSLYDRLIELLNDCAIIEEVLEKTWNGNDSEKEDSICSFAKSIRDTRNYLTHYEKSLSKKSLEGIELYNTSERLDIIIRYFIFIELGFTPIECKKIFDNIYHFSYQHFMGNKK